MNELVIVKKKEKHRREEVACLLKSAHEDVHHSGQSPLSRAISSLTGFSPFSTIQHSFQVPSEEPGPGVCRALCWALVVWWSHQTGPLPKLIFNSEGFSEEGPAKRGCAGWMWVGQAAGRSSEAEGTGGWRAGSRGNRRVKGRKQREERRWRAGRRAGRSENQSLMSPPSPLGDPFPG